MRILAQLHLKRPLLGSYKEGELQYLVYPFSSKLASGSIEQLSRKTTIISTRETIVPIRSYRGNAASHEAGEEPSMFVEYEWKQDRVPWVPSRIAYHNNQKAGKPSFELKLYVVEPKARQPSICSFAYAAEHIPIGCKIEIRAEDMTVLKTSYKGDSLLDYRLRRSAELVKRSRQQ